MKSILAAPSPPTSYLLREAVLILLWAYVLLVGGTINGLFAFRVQLASAILLAALAALWLGVRVWQRRLLAWTGLEWAAIVFVLAQAVSALFSQDVRRSLPLVAQSVAYLLVFYCAVDLTRAGWPAELTEKTLLIVGGIMIGLGWLDLAQVFLRWLALVAGQTYAPDFQYRIYAPLGDANLLAGCLVVLMPLAAARALASPRRFIKSVLGLWLAAALVVQVFTSSRGGLAALAIAFGALALGWISIVSPAARDRAGRAWAALRARPFVLGLLVILMIMALALVVVRVFQFRGNAMQSSVVFARQGFWGAALSALAESPVWGKGPGTFPTEYMRAVSTPPERPYLHAHSITFNTAAEMGALGLGAALFAVGAIAWALWRARGKASYPARARWAAVAAGWAGFLAHSQVDDHTRYLAVSVPLAVLLAVALVEESPVERPARFHPLWLILPGLAAGAFAVYSLRAYAISERAVESAQGGDWAQAAQLFDEAAAADPGLAFYWQQAGYAYGRLAAAGDQAALAAGIERLERGRALEPYYSVTYGNLAALEWQAGRQIEALATMRQAAALAPGAAVYQLNLGLYQEALQDADAARAAYRSALDLDPGQADSGFWSVTELRRSVRDGWRAARPAAALNLLEAVRRSLAQGQAGAAEQSLIESWRQDRQQLQVYVGLAEVARARGDLTAADRYLENALWVQTTQVSQQVEALLVSAEVAQAQGHDDAAIGRYLAVLSALSEYGSQGWGSAGWTPHDFFVFQRRGLPLDVIPQVARASFTPAMGQRLLALGDLYAAHGQPDEAKAVYRRLLELDPGLDEARRRLEAP